MIRTAAIVAAGLGSRMGPRTADRPKGFLLVDDLPLIEHSINKLIDAGIRKIIIGTGYLSEWYEDLSRLYPQIICVHNPDFSTTGSLQTLYQLKEEIDEDFLLLESDLLYERQALHALLAHSQADIVLASGPTHSSDEVFIEVDERQHLVHMSKIVTEISCLYGELVGITKISLAVFRQICEFAAVTLCEKPELHYEDALVGIAKHANILVHKVEDLAWCEMDNEQHLQRALHVIFPIVQARDAMPVNVVRKVLLNPGPATTTDTVKYAQIVPDICPREQEFGEVLTFIATELTQFVADDADTYTTVLFGGSGTAAVESVLSSVVDQNAIIIINNGAYGKRMCQIAEAYGLPLLEFVSPVDDALDLAALETFIATSAQPVSHLAVVHSETTTGLLNDIEAVGALCQTYQIQMIVDAMSSFAAIPIQMEQMNISYLAASSNKNLQGMAGISFVIAQTDHLEASRLIHPRNFYLHLYSQYHHQKTTQQMRFTPPVQTFYALKQAIIETKREGIPYRYARYQKSWRVLNEGLQRLGLSYLVPDKHHSKLITSIVEPSSESFNFLEMHDYFYSNSITIYPGKLDRLNTFRIANIGDITYMDIERFLYLLEQYLTKVGGGVVDHSNT